MIRHVVLARFPAEATPAAIAALFDELSDLQAVLPGMLSFEGGVDVSPEGLARGFTHAFTVDFVDAAARDAYLVHPAHKAAGARLVAALKGGVDGILVFDFEAAPS
jgi:stress responsive alpha/beta barrel protein